MAQAENASSSLVRTPSNSDRGSGDLPGGVQGAAPLAAGSPRALGRALGRGVGRGGPPEKSY
jgi:hypothetical protein